LPIWANTTPEPDRIEEKLRSLGLWPERGESAILDPRRFKTTSRYYRRVLEDMNHRCRGLGIRFVVVQLYLLAPSRGPAHELAQEELKKFLQRTARRLDFDFFNTKSLFRDQSDCYLPRDGHFNDEGHLRLANFLARRVLAESPCPRR
jgi:hypothetical protein